MNVAMQLTKIIILLCLIVGLIGCGVQNGAPISSQLGTPELTTTLIMEKNLVFESVEDEIALDYPFDWTVSGDSLFWVDPNEADLPQDHSSVLTEVRVMIFTNVPYSGRNSRRWKIPQPAHEVLQWEINESSSTVVEPVQAVSINGRDAATVLLAYKNKKGTLTLYQYSIALRISDDKVVHLVIDGPASRSEEMQNVLNAIALNIRPLDGE